MQSNLISLLKGFVRIRIRGQHPELLLNRLVKSAITVWNVSHQADELELDIHVRDYSMIRAHLRATSCRSRVIGRFGLPFWLARLERRKFLAGGFILFAVGLYLLSSLVWRVDVVGVERLTADQVRAIAAEQGLRPFQWKFRLPDPDTLSAQLTQKLPDVSWVGVTVQGTHVQIEVIENTIPEELPLLNPRHLVSTSDAIVTTVFAEQGKPLVHRNTRVSKGDILISGIIGNEENQETVVAKGEVKGLVWHEYRITVPLTQTRKVYTGDTQSRFYLVFGSRALQITGYGKEEFEQYETERDRKILKWRQFELPIGWMDETLKKAETIEKQISKEEAEQIGLAQARADIIAKFGADAEIHGEKILHEKKENGKVYMEVLFEVEHVISEGLPIIHTEDIE